MLSSFMPSPSNQAVCTAATDSENESENESENDEIAVTKGGAIELASVSENSESTEGQNSTYLSPT